MPAADSDRCRHLPPSCRSPKATTGLLSIAVAALLLFPPAVGGQGPTSDPLPRSAVSLDAADNATLAHLERFEALLAEQQWQEAVETIRLVAETSGDHVLLAPGTVTSPHGFFRHLPAAAYCQLRLAELAVHSPQALALYRRQVDPVASQLLNSNAESPHDQEVSLRQLTTQYFASSHADQACLRLGELAFERGDWTAARGYWQRISPLLRFPPHDDPQFSEFSGQPLWLIARQLETEEDWAKTLPLLQSSTGDANWLAYRDTDLDLADIHARLVLASILEGNFHRARVELELARRLFPTASGRIGGRTGPYVELLENLLQEGQTWPLPPADHGWPTLAGSVTRQRIATPDCDLLELLKGSPRWELALPTFSGEGELLGSDGTRVGESSAGLLSYHPIVVGDTVIVQAGISERQIVARRIDNGSVVFGVDELPDKTIAAAGLSRSVGVPRFPLSADGKIVYARVGSLPTGTNVDLRQQREPPATIVGLDLASEGRRTVELQLAGPPWDAEWSFDGVPIAVGDSLLIALRHRSAVRAESYVACFDARTARLRWRRMLVGAEPVGTQRPFELTHTLLSLRDQTVYCNTNLGVVAALDVRNGEIQWLVEYQRVDLQDEHPDRNTRHLFRDRTPCLLYRDLVIVAPQDCDRLFALDANTGILIWASLPGQAADAVHLLGVGQEHLIASGDYLYWFDVYTGHLVSQFPAPHRSQPGHAKPSPHGYGRGILADKLVYWPTRESILIFDQRIPSEQRGRPPELIEQIDLATRGLTGGNLVVTNNSLLIAAPNRLIAFDRDETRIPPRAERGQSERTAGD